MSTKQQEEFRKYPIAESYSPGIQHVPDIQLAVWFLVLMYSISVSFITNSKWYFMIFYYLAGMMAFYLWHVQAHYKMWWNKSCFNHHMRHHFVYYPWSQFFGSGALKEKWKIDKYNLLQDRGFFGKFRHFLPFATSIAHEGLLYVFGVTILCVSYFILDVSKGTVTAAFIGYAIMGCIANYLHQAFHVKRHFLEEYDWFHDLRAQHYLHHTGSTRHNYAIIGFKITDEGFGSYVNRAPHDSAKEKGYQNAINNPPNGISRASLQYIQREMNEPIRERARRPLLSVFFRLLIVTAFILAWFETQSLILKYGSYDGLKPTGHIIDRIHILLSPAHTMLLSNPKIADWIISYSSKMVDVMAVGIIALSVFGSTFRPFVSLVIVFTIRQICQLLIQLPPPSDMIWRDPGTFTLLVTYNTNNDFFFSGHTAIAVVAGIELVKWARKCERVRIWKFSLAFALCTITFEALSVLLLRSHWTMDVLTAIIAAVYSTIISNQVSHTVDNAFP